MESTTSIIPEASMRAERLRVIKKAGIDPFVSQADRSHRVGDLLKILDETVDTDKTITLVGRVRSIRNHGGSTFAHLEDNSGQFQIYLKEDKLPAGAYQNFIDFIDVGDFLQVSGAIFKTKKGEPTLLAADWRLLTKALLPLPAKWHGLQDVELRFRQRYLDLLSNQTVRDTFWLRANIVKAIRAFLDERGYLEVDTPILQPLPGGANARPFVTHHNALDTDLYLRVAPELYLKRLLVGGYERVYEIARCFRNEGMDWSHNPEFTQVEFYEAYLDYNGMMSLTEDLLLAILRSVLGTATITYQGQEIKFAKPFPRLAFRQALIDFAKIDIEDYPDQPSIYKAAQKHGLPDVKPQDGRGKICDEFYKEFVRKHLIQPTFIIDHPIELSPLSKQKAADPRYVERFQLVVGAGIELCNAFSELNDPEEQRRRFADQQALREAGDEEAQPLDEDFIEALKHGLPPAAGFGMGIDRLTGLLADNRNIKEVILFPTLRPKDKS